MATNGQLIDLDQSQRDTSRGTDGLASPRWHHGLLVGVLLIGVVVGGLGGWLLGDHQQRRESAVVELVALAGRMSSRGTDQLAADLTLVNAGGRSVSVRVVDTETPGLTIADAGGQARIPPASMGSIPVLLRFDCATVVHRYNDPVPVRLSATVAGGRVSEVSYPVAINGDWREWIDRSCRLASRR
ncbi:hypothetical protein [Micromonospora sp. LOL_023]|uniref:hypothetical protein n=1 Tax=Micromonospora sp. LOL_023 TaxID=3345418 RepID=UPI003A8946AB